MPDLVEECCRVHANERRALNHAPALTDDEWSELWAADELRDGFLAPMRAVIATIGAGLTNSHLQYLAGAQDELKKLNLHQTAKHVSEAAAVIAAIVEANRHD